MAYKDLINMQTNWGSFLPGGKPFRYNAANPTAANIYGQEYDTSTWQPIVDQTQDDRVVPTMGSHVLHPRATERYNEYNAAMRDLIEKNPDQLGTINPSGKVNKMSMLPDISHINWSGILQGGKNFAKNFGKNNEAMTKDRAWYDNLTFLNNNPFLSLGRIRNPMLPKSFHQNWSEMGSDTPIDDIQKQVTETETIDPYGNDPYGTEHHYVTPDKKRSLPTFGLSGILKGLKNQFKINPEKQKEFDSWEENKNQKGWGSIGDTGLKGNIYEGPGGKKFSLVDPTTGYNVLQNKNWRGGTGNSLREQINLKNAWIADRLLRGKGLSGKARAYAKLNKLGTYADKETFTPPPGGGPLNEPGGEWVGGAPAYTHQGIGGGEYTNEIGNVEYQDPYDPGGGEAAGGLMRIHSRGRYSKGGRVGILSVF